MEVQFRAFNSAVGKCLALRYGLRFPSIHSKRRWVRFRGNGTWAE